MTRESQKELYKLEVKAVSELLYTLAGLDNEGETTHVADFCCAYSGYDIGELLAAIKEAKERAEAIARRGIL